MEHIPQLVVDLALLLAAAAIATIVCKRLKQPLVLGYVVAGFLISPGIELIPNITDNESISTWSEIGVIFLMFGLGLEFSVIKLTSVGKSGIFTAFADMTSMLVLGYLSGRLLGWTLMTSLFLGATLAISSTTIINKAFAELEIKGRSFTDLVFGALIVEDIVGVFIMIILSAVSTGSEAGAGALVVQVGQMAIYLIIWFVLSVLVVPTVLKQTSNMLTDEILLVSSIALCMIMVVLANLIGFSAALGSFMAGSILAGTIQAHRIHQLVKSVVDFFGAVFFVSVGMLVSPQIIIENIVPILVLTVIVLSCKPVSTTIGTLLSKQSLRASVQTGFSFCQIGEFSFIIAALGAALDVTDNFLYPIIVAVSVITTFITPYYIKYTNRVYESIVFILPQRFLELIERHVSQGQGQTEDGAWSSYFRHWIVKVIMVILAAFSSVVLLSEVVRPLISGFGIPLVTDIFIDGLALIIIGVFISNLYATERRGDVAALWAAGHRSRSSLYISMFINILISISALAFAVSMLEGLRSVWLFVPALLLTLVFANSNLVHSAFLRLENLFIRNLRESQLAETRSVHSDDDPVSWVSSQLLIISVEAYHWREINNRIVSVELAMAQSCNLDLLSIQRNDQDFAGSLIAHMTQDEIFRRMNDPYDELSLMNGDILTLMGTEREIEVFMQNMIKTFARTQQVNLLDNDQLALLGTEDEIEAFTQNIIDYYASDQHELDSLTLFEYKPKTGYLIGSQSFRLQINADSPFRGKTIATSRLEEEYGCKILAIEHANLLTLKPNRNMRISLNDYLWIYGNSLAVNELASQYS
ncbi:MAG: cation:proton antiporter [Coriobacteriia bacterium]|nr:cation:proton antiporter [Coriobacteriia bacterium]